METFPLTDADRKPMSEVKLSPYPSIDGRGPRRLNLVTQTVSQPNDEREAGIENQSPFSRYI